MKRDLKKIFSVAMSLLLSSAAIAAQKQIPEGSPTESGASPKVQQQTSYKVQCQMVDAHIQKDISENLQDALVYTLNVISNDPDYIALGDNVLSKAFRVTKATKLSEEYEGYDQLNPVQQMWLICLVDMLTTEYYSDQEKMRNYAKLCSLMLSKDFANKEFRNLYITHPYSLISSAAVSADSILNLNIRTLVENMKEKETFTMRASTNTSDNCLLPMMFVAPHNVYDIKTFIYALSKGCSLYGLGAEDFFGHGRAFMAPYLAYSHDYGHEGELIERKRFKNEGAKSLKVLESFCSKFLRILDETETFANEEKPLAIHAMFLLLHETQIKAYIPKESIYSTESTHMKLFEGIDHRFGVEQFLKDFPHNFVYRFFSDLGFEIVKLKPELTHTLFPEGKEQVEAELRIAHAHDSDETLSYDLERTIDENINLIKWLKEKLSPHLK